MAQKPDNTSNSSASGPAAAADISTILADQTPVDRATTAQSADLDVLQIPKGVLPAPKDKSLFSEPAVQWCLTFLVGSVRLRYFPRRPGLWRRRALLGVGCAQQCALHYYSMRYNSLVHDAFYSPEDSPEHLFWRRLSLVHEVPGASKALDIDRIEAAFMEMGDLELWKCLVQLAAQRETDLRRKLSWRKWLYYSLVSSAASRHHWAVINCLNVRQLPHKVAEKDAQELLFLQPVYLSMVEATPTWQSIVIYSHGGMMAATVVGLLARHRLVLRLSLLTGVIALAVSCGTTALWHSAVVYEPASFKELKVLNETLGMFFKDPRTSGTLPPSLQLAALLDSSTGR